LALASTSCGEKAHPETQDRSLFFCDLRVCACKLVDARPKAWHDDWGADGAEPLDLSKLPPPSDRAVDFARDVQPIFEAHCVKCHGPEKQKGGWRVDVKEVALTDGDNYAPNIHPGKSAESPMIHFVAGLDPDMKMSHFTKHWTKPLQDKVLESMEAIVCLFSLLHMPFYSFLTV